MKLSILVCSTHNRYKTFLPAILDQLFGQFEKLDRRQKEDVEILTLVDNKTIMLGTKRNNLIEISKGDYLVFVDDDDRISDDYIVSLLDATSSGKDVINFTVSVSLNGEEPKPCFYSIEYKNDFNSVGKYHRLPNHIMCVRRDLAEQVMFKPILYGEDSDYSKRLRPFLKSQHVIDKVLYHYDYNIDTTEAQEYQREKLNRLRKRAKCDVVILSNAKNKKLEEVTRNAVKSLLQSEQAGTFNVIIIEQSDVRYPGTQTIHMPGEFNYNKFANLGIKKGIAPWVCIANNDLIFEKNWFSEMMKVRDKVMSPKNPGDKRQATIYHPQRGNVIGRHFAGWCFVMGRSTWEKIGGLDEDFPFWCADNAAMEQLKAIRVPATLVPASKVKHLASETLSTLTKDEKHAKTIVQVKRFNRKYNQNLFNLGK